MGILLLICMTELIATVASAVLLIKMDGWLATLLAILLILQLMLNGSVILTSGLLDHVTKHTKPTNKKEEET